MMLAWIGYAMLCSGALLATGACAELALHRRHYPRRALWIAIMGASVSVPIVASIVAAPRLVSSPPPGAAMVPVSGTADMSRVAAMLWAAASLAIAVWLVAVQLWVRRALRRCERARIDGVPVIVSPDFGPAVVGVLRPVIVLPAWSLTLPPDDLRLVLSHEEEHRRAHDPALQLAGLALVVSCPWNLALWRQLARLRLAIEIDCDARVIVRGRDDRFRYGELLIAAHGTSAAPIRSALALVHRRSALARRVDALVGTGRRSARRVVVSGVSAAALAAAVAFVPAPAARVAVARPSVAAIASRATVATPAATTAAATPATAPARRVVRRARTAAPSDRLAAVVPPLRIIADQPSGATAFASPFVAPLPASAVRARAAGLVPSARGGFARAAAGRVGDGRGAAAGRIGGVVRAAPKPPI